MSVVDASAVLAIVLEEPEAAAIKSTLAEEAVEAFRRFKSRANGRLNLGDSFAYALAKREGGALLFKGDDFTKTDLVSVL